MTEKVKQIIEDSLPITFKASQAAEEIAQMFCDEVVRIEKYGDNHLGLSVRLMLKQMGFTEQQIINSLEKTESEMTQEQVKAHAESLRGKIESLRLEKQQLEEDLMDLENDLDGTEGELEDLQAEYPDLF